MPENPASYRVVRTKSYLFNKAVLHIYSTLSLIWRYNYCLFKRLHHCPLSSLLVDQGCLY
ncbi:hypothetical protein DXF85_22515 [Citrobacter pasteurii]|uniref:Uncharacterized protein n=1 Tax=Citrobacter pasteurii TaxID=1563222 RepID=A0A6N6JXR8_9ENTR|nr:hypothetical protein DXF85_22515 [Citrobacter pasteurii]